MVFTLLRGAWRRCVLVRARGDGGLLAVLGGVSNSSSSSGNSSIVARPLNVAAFFWLQVPRMYPGCAAYSNEPSMHRIWRIGLLGVQVLPLL